MNRKNFFKVLIVGKIEHIFEFYKLQNAQTFYGSLSIEGLEGLNSRRKIK
jgi:hypothetical protein